MGDYAFRGCSGLNKIEFEGKEYTSFCNSYSLALTTEDCGEMDLFNTETGTYPDVTRLITYDGIENKINFTKVIAKAKSKGYKLKKSEVNGNNYLMFYEGLYFRIGLLDATFGIINDGKEAAVYHTKNGIKPITIKTNIGVCVIMPIRYESEPDDGVIIIEACGRR